MTDHTGGGHESGLDVVRMRALGAAVVAVVIALAGASGSAARAGDVAAPADAVQDPVVASDAGIRHVYALAGTVLYSSAEYPVTDAPWLRIVAGQRLAVAGLPAGSAVTGIGLDPGGRVVATVRHEDIVNGWPANVRWWLYDVASDTSRGLDVPVRAGCWAEHVAVWRARTAYAEFCPAEGELRDSGYFQTRLIVRGGSRTRRIGDRFGFWQGIEEGGLLLRGRSLAARLRDVGDNSTVMRVLDRGRRCIAAVGGGGEYGWSVAKGAWIAAGALQWANGTGGDFDYEPGPYTDVAIMSVELSGACEKRPVQRSVPAPAVPMLAFAIDGRSLYYATDTALYRHELPETGSTAPPPNDDFEHAAPLGGTLPMHVVGTVGHATRQAGEPLIRRPFTGRSTVWYAFRPAQTGWAELSVVCEACVAGLFTGSRLSNLRRVHVKPVGAQFDGGPWLFPVKAGRPYRIVVATGGGPTYAPFQLDLTAAGAPPANDDLAHATRLRGPLPIQVVGSIGNATGNVGNEPQIGTRTVWYRYRPSVTRRVALTFRCNTCQAYVFTGSPRAELRSPPGLGQVPVPQGTPRVLRVRARRNYWIGVGAYEVTDEQFTMDLAPAGSSRGAL